MLFSWKKVYGLFISIIFTISNNAFAAPLPNQPQQADQVNMQDQASVMSTIQKYRSTNQLDKAQTLAETYLKSHPRDVDVNLLLALVLYQQKKFDQAAPILEQVLKITPGYLDAKFALIRIKVIQKKYTEAAALIEEVKKQAPNIQDLADVQDFYNRALNASPPAGTKSIYDQIKELRQKDNLAAAQQMATDYLAKHPDDVDVKLLLGLIYYQQAYFDKAEPLFLEILAKAPQYLDAKIALFRIKIMNRQFPEAKTLLDEIIKQNPNAAEIPELKNIYERATARIDFI